MTGDPFDPFDLPATFDPLAPVTPALPRRRRLACIRGTGREVQGSQRVPRSAALSAMAGMGSTFEKARFVG
jgi:hypothetical protein